MKDFETVKVIQEYLKLIRLYGILFIGFTPVFGALCNGQYDGFSLFMLLFLGVLGHIFVFVQNDYFDMEVDQQSKYVVQRPLISGAISRSQARGLFLSAFFISLIIVVVFFFSFRSVVILLLSFLLMTLYNRYSKKTPGMEYVLAAAVFCYGVFGAFTVSEEISFFALSISCVAALQWIFSVGVSANLKDVEYDTKLGITTTPVLFGTQVVDNELQKPFSFIVYAYIIKFLHVGVALLPLIFGYSSYLINGFPFPLVSFFIVAFLLLYTTRGILTTSLRNRNLMLIYEGAHEGLALLLIPVVLLSILTEHFGIMATFLLMLSLIAWPLLCLRFLYGKSLIPLE